MQSFPQISIIIVEITTINQRNLKEDLNKALSINLFSIKKPCKRAEEMKMKTHTRDLMETKIRTSIKITKIPFHRDKYPSSPLQDSTLNLMSSKTTTWKEILKIAFFLIITSEKSLTVPEKELLMTNTVLLGLDPQALVKVETSTPVRVKAVPEPMAKTVRWPVSFEESSAEKLKCHD